MKDHKDLWDMRDLPLPSKEETSVKQSVKARSSLAEWNNSPIREPQDFWQEWDSEIEGGRSRKSQRPIDRNFSEKSLDRSSLRNDRYENQVEIQNTGPTSAPEKHIDDADIHLEPWAAQLAFHERRLEKEGTADYGLPFRKQEVLVEKTKDFARVLQSVFRKHIEVFNQARKDPSHSIHIYKISRSDEDFLIYRNGVKLIISAQRAGRITLSFNQFLAPHSQSQSHAHVELEAVWGPFDQLLWMYKGERVQVSDIAQFFVSELAFQSFR